MSLRSNFHKNFSDLPAAQVPSCFKVPPVPGTGPKLQAKKPNVDSSWGLRIWTALLLERELQRHLHDARRAGAADLPHGRGANTRHRPAEIGAVERVEHLPAVV